MSEPVLEVHDLSVSFDGFQALSGVDLTVEEGELRFLIGPNGAGKTTLVDCITGLTKATSGEIRFRGPLDPRRQGAQDRPPRHRPELPDPDGVRGAHGGAEPRHRRPRSGAAWCRCSASGRRCCPKVSADARAHRPGRPRRIAGKHLSHGQKQWLEIGMLLVQEPELLLLDEPVAGMSPEERLETGELLQELAQDHTVVVIEHDMEFLRRFAKRVTVLHEGKVLSEGTVDEVQSDPKVQEVYLGRSRDERSGAVVEPDAIEPVPFAPDEVHEVAP